MEVVAPVNDFSGAPVKASVMEKMVGTSQSAKNANCDVATCKKSVPAVPSGQGRRPSSSKEAASCNPPIAKHKSTETGFRLAAPTTKRPATSSDPCRPSKMIKNCDSEVKSHTLNAPPTALPPGKCGVTEATPNMQKKSVQTNTDQKLQWTPEAPHSTSQVAVKPEEKNLGHQPSCDSASKPAKRSPVVGEWCWE